MNIWDALILLALLSAVLFGVRMRKRKPRGCSCGCSGCAMNCAKKKE